MKLEVGMYVRNNYFGIGKINKEYFDSNNKHWFNVQFNCYKKKIVIDEIATLGFKASFNIIDLVEVGDYVNGERVMVSYHGLYVGFDGMEEPIILEDIKIYEVLTHEQYEANCYKVVE